MKTKTLKVIFIVTTIGLIVVTVSNLKSSSSGSSLSIDKDPKVSNHKLHEHDDLTESTKNKQDGIDKIVQEVTTDNPQALPLSHKLDVIIQKKDLDQFKDILQDKENIKEVINDFSPEDGRTLLTRASFGGDVSFVEFLVEDLGADIDHVDRDKITPLMEAAASENTAVVEYLLSKNADIHAVNKLGADALTMALTSGDPQLATILLGRGSNPNLKWNKKNFSHLMNAARSGHRELVQVLIGHGARINDKDELGNTALHYAAAQGFKDIVTDLLQSGAIKEIQNNDKDMPIDLARKEGFSFIEQALE